MSSENLSTKLVISLLLLLSFLWVMDYTHADLLIEDMFYSNQTKQWLVEKSEFWPRAVFYNGVKISIIIFAVGMIGLFIASFRNPKLEPHRSALLFVILSLAIIPGTIAFLKFFTGVPCPYQLTRYGGPINELPAFLDFTFPNGAHRSACFPAGHPSGGFALLSIAYVIRNQLAAIFVGASLGSIMSAYQMLRGAHFLSHCVATLIIAILIMEILKYIFIRTEIHRFKR